MVLGGDLDLPILGREFQRIGNKIEHGLFHLFGIHPDLFSGFPYDLDLNPFFFSLGETRSTVFSIRS